MIAGGGTGGHLFPGIAIAEAFMTRQPGNRLLFIGTGKPFERRALDHVGFDHRAITVSGLKGKNRWRQLIALIRIPLGIGQAWRHLARFRPHLLLSVGGYSAGPAAMAAWLMRIPVALHEQNALPGLTNRLLSRLARRLYVSFPDTGFAADAGKMCFTGNPVRRDFQAAPALRDQKSREFTVLIVGGSQGAHRINEAVADALLHLPADVPIRFIHQTGEADRDWVAARYAEHGFDHDVSAFYTEMAGAYHQADMIICRAGATTVAEITALGRAAVFIPLPHAADNHQVVNARALVRAGAAEMIEERDLDGADLAAMIMAMASNRTRVADMAAAARRLGRPEAASQIVTDIYRHFLTGRGDPAEADGSGDRDTDHV